VLTYSFTFFIINIVFINFLSPLRALQAKTAQSIVSGNVFFNGPRAGINANDGFGGGDVISHNLVFSTCRESGDHGPFNSWDRYVLFSLSLEPQTMTVACVARPACIFTTTTFCDAPKQFPFRIFIYS
jgi:hypothetical protein